MFATKRSTSILQIKCTIISHRSYMVIKSKTAKRFQNITAIKIKRKKKDKLKSRYKEHIETEPLQTAFTATNPTQIQCRYLLTHQVNHTKTEKIHKYLFSRNF